MWETRYDGRVHPGSVPRPDVADPWPAAANCQVFAYVLLAHHGRRAPWVRSSELWSDESATFVVDRPEPLDLVLIHHRPDAYGAHVAVAVDEHRVVHLARIPGRPEVRDLSELLDDPRYCCLVGFKRVR